MAKQKKQYELVLDILLEASPQPVSRAQFEEKLGAQLVASRLPSYLWDIKNKSKIPVESVKEGRKVLGWFIADPKPLVPVEPIVSASDAASDEPTDV